MEQNCKNCNSPLINEPKYCSNCGQSVTTIRQPLVPFLKESLHELLDIDGRLSLTLKSLITKPGLVSREYEQGMRAKYTPPMRLYLVVSVIFFLLFSTFQRAFIGQDGYTSASIELYSKAMFILFPLFGFYIKALYPSSYVVPNLIFSLHIHTVSYLVLILMGPLELIERYHSGLLVLQAPLLLYFCWYFFKAFKVMYQASWPVTLVKSSAIYLIYMATMGLMFDVVLTN